MGIWRKIARRATKGVAESLSQLPAKFRDFDTKGNYTGEIKQNHGLGGLLCNIVKFLVDALVNFVIYTTAPKVLLFIKEIPFLMNG